MCSDFCLTHPLLSAKKNLVVVDRFKNAGLVHSVEGRHNNCKVVLRAVPPGYGMKGSRTAKAVLTQMGISDCTAKAHGRRNPFSVVRALFKVDEKFPWEPHTDPTPTPHRPHPDPTLTPP